MSLERSPHLLLVVAVSTMITVAAGCGNASEIQSIPPSSQIVDVRTPGEFAIWHFPGAVNIPVDQLEGRLKELAPERTIVVYCRSGSRSSVAKRILLANGFTKVENGGGLRDIKRFVGAQATAKR